MEAKTDRRIKRTRYLLVHALTSLMLKKSIKDITVKNCASLLTSTAALFTCTTKIFMICWSRPSEGLLEQFEQVFKNYHPDHTGFSLSAVCRNFSDH